MSQPALFDAVPQAVRRLIAARVVAYGMCPECRGTGRRTGLQRQGAHLVWREHRYTTWSGTRMTCRASGVRLCALPARPSAWSTPRCSCDG